MTSKKYFFSITVLALTLAWSQSSFSKSLTNRLGVGYKNQFSIDMPAIAAQYYPSEKIGISGAIGLDTLEDQSRFGFMARLHRIIFQEDNLNFYMGTGLGFVSQEIGQVTTSGFELQGFIGTEYFFQGLDSLGFTFEAGVGVSSLQDNVRFKTFGHHPLLAGIIFYF